MRQGLPQVGISRTCKSDQNESAGSTASRQLKSMQANKPQDKCNEYLKSAAQEPREATKMQGVPDVGSSRTCKQHQTRSSKTGRGRKSVNTRVLNRQRKKSHRSLARTMERTSGVPSDTSQRTNRSAERHCIQVRSTTKDRKDCHKMKCIDFRQPTAQL